MQVPAQFEYERATSIAHAVQLLGKYNGAGRLIAGGHSLIPMMKLRLARPEVLIDINEVAELGGISRVDGELRVGALVRHTELLDDDEVAQLFPILRDAEKVIADPIVRNRGTVGGSVCQADPSEDLSAAFSALRAYAVVQGPETQRIVPLRDFFVGPYETVVGPGELLVELRVPVRTGGSSAFLKVSRRAGDWAVGAVGAAVWLDGDVITEVGIGLSALGARNFVAVEAEDFLRGRSVSADVLGEAGRIAAEHCDPPVDQRGPADYKRHLAATLVTRALQLACRRAGREV